MLKNNDDSIKEIDNTCNAELLSKDDMQEIVGSNVIVKINGL